MIVPINIVPNVPMINAFIEIIVGSIFVFIIIFVLKTNCMKNFLAKYLHKSPSNTIWEDIIDFKNGANLKIYLKDKDYYLIGHYKSQEEYGEASWLALSSFAKFDKTTNEVMENEPSYLNDKNTFVVVRLCDIDYVEIFQ